MKKIIKKTWSKISDFNFFVVSKLTMVIILFIGLFYTIHLFCNTSKDTTPITNVAFGIVASLAALSFSCSRAISDSNEDKELFQFAGEKFFHAGIMLITASIIKYAILAINEYAKLRWLVKILGYTIPLLFICALIAAHGGFIINNKLLWKRFKRHWDWDNFF
jgi:L-cystine uptake protein TcyP (sodium:dicarboxylate symporter family)